MDERLLIQLSAYADGEVDPRTRAELEQQLAQRPEWRAALAHFKQLDVTAAALPVPDLTARFASRLLSPVALARDLDAPLPSVLAAQLSRVPELPAQRFDAVWKAIAQRTVAPSASDRDAMQASARADGEAAATGDAGDVSAHADTAVWKQLDAAAARLPVPQMSTAAASEAAEELAARVGPLAAARRAMAGDVEIKTAVPQVSSDKWDGVWKKIEPKVSARAQAVQAAASARVVPLPARRRSTRWRWMAGASIAAMLAVALLLKISPLTNGPSEDAAAWDLPKSDNDRYDVTVEYVKGDPVVCYYLKPEARSGDANHDWRWLPD